MLGGPFEPPHAPSVVSSSSLGFLSTITLDHLHDGADRGRWLVKLDVVSAPVSKHVLAIGRQLEELGLLAAASPDPLIQSTRQHDQGSSAEARDGARLPQASPSPMLSSSVVWRERGVTHDAT